MNWARMWRLKLTGQFGPAWRDFAATVAKLPVPQDVTEARVDDRSFTDIFGGRIGAYMNGTFDLTAEDLAMARRFGRQLSGLLRVPAFALYDLLRADSSKFGYWMGARQS